MHSVRGDEWDLMRAVQTLFIIIKMKQSISNLDDDSKINKILF